jgi:uncharacterized protein (TIGR00730 family)
MKTICVFCGSSPGGSPVYVNAAKQMGTLLAKSGITLVYGGGSVGLMGELARSALAAGGRVVGVIPQKLFDLEVALGGLNELHVVTSMHERKALMEELAEGFVALPGGLGTFEETFEILTWAQLGLHQKPVGFLNVNGYYDRLSAFLDHAMQEQFVQDIYRKMILQDETPEQLLKKMQAYSPPHTDKAAWVKALDAKRLVE